MKLRPQHMVACFKKTCKFDGKNVTVPENFAVSFWKSFASGLPKTVRYRIAKSSTYFGSKLRAYLKLTPKQWDAIPNNKGIVKGSDILNPKLQKDLKFKITPEELLKHVGPDEDISMGNFVDKRGDWLDGTVILKAQLFLVKTLINASTFDGDAIIKYMAECKMPITFGGKTAIPGHVVLKLHKSLKKKCKFSQKEDYEFLMDMLEFATKRAYSALNPEDLDVRKLKNPHINVRTEVFAAKPCREPKGGRKATYEWEKDNGAAELWAMDSEGVWYVYAVFYDDTTANRVRRPDGTIKYLPKRTAMEKLYDEDKDHLFDWNIGGPKPPRKPEPKPKAKPKPKVDEFDFSEFSF